MSRAIEPKFRRRFLLSLSMVFVFLAATAPSIVSAHNNPGFKEVLLMTIEVKAEPIDDAPFAVHSEAFTIDLPKKTIELIWRIADGAGDGVTFSVAQGDSLNAEGLTDGANSRILRGSEVRIVDVQGASGPISIEVYANVIDRSKPAES